MAQRALLIGSQTGGLTGVHGDVEVMADALELHGFDTRPVIESGASADGIAAAYRELIDDTSADDAVVVYYSGHGARVRNAMRARDASLPTWLQYIVPTDIDDRSGGRFGGILAEELSGLQRELTERTANVTTLLDCCHSARMSRNPSIVPKANDRFGFPWDALVSRWQTARAMVGPGDVNPLAVQVVACEPDQSAYELASSSIGGTHGALTAALVTLLRRPDATTLNWNEVIELVRPAVLDVIPAQRPDVLGSKGALDRLVFSLHEKDTCGVLGLVVDTGGVWLERAGLFGVAEGDRYALVAPGGGVRAPLATAVVETIAGDRARLRVDGVASGDLPAGTLAHPLEVSLGRRPVAVVPPDHPAATALLEALRSSPHVRLVDGDDHAARLATVRVDDGGLALLDAGGAPLTAEPRPPTAGGVALVVESLRKLARATHVRELASGTGHTALPDDVELRHCRLDTGTGVESPLTGGEHLFVGDALVVRATNTTSANRYVSVLDIGLTGAIEPMTAAQPSGATVAPNETLVVGADAAGVVQGVTLFWPEGLPKDGPRPETMITLIADAPIDGLSRLAQAGVKTRGLSPAGAGRSTIERLIDDLSVGRRDGRPPDAPAKPTRYRVHRLDFLLHPTARPPEVEEPAFEIDRRPDPTFRLVVPKGIDAPRRVEVRLTDLVVNGNPSGRAGRARVDVLVATTPADDGAVRFVATTRLVDDDEDDDALTVYAGPVGRSLELAVWLSTADPQERGLADLLAAELGGATVIGGVDELVGTAARLLDQVAGSSIGVYRTALLPHERFGAGSPTQRHPAAGRFDAPALSLAYEVMETGTED